MRGGRSLKMFDHQSVANHTLNEIPPGRLGSARTRAGMVDETFNQQK